MKSTIALACAISFLFGAIALMSASEAAPQPQNRIDSFHPLTSFGVANGVAEIVDVSADGNTLVYSNASGAVIGFVDITNPLAPVALPDVPMPGEPTSVAVHGTIAVAAVQVDLPDEGQPAPNFDPGALVVMDISNPAAVIVLGTVDIGWQPDSAKLLMVGNQLTAIVCIENQPVILDGNGLVTDGEDAGDPNDVSPAGVVQVVSLDLNNVAGSLVVDVAFPTATMAAAGLYFPNDAQPEFVAVNGTTAYVTLQENSGFAKIDIANPAAPQLLAVYSSGVAGNRLADLDDDAEINFNRIYPGYFNNPNNGGPTDPQGNPIAAGSRCPDALAISSDGSTIYFADEGELDYTGGRGWSAFNANGQLVFEERNLEKVAVALGQYPEGRSDAKGIEVEGITTGKFGRNEFAFVLSERGSFMAVYKINNPSHPRLVQVLPTGISPEGVVCIPSRNLVVTADEGSGTLTIFEGQRGIYKPSSDRPQLYTPNVLKPFTAISGLCSNASGTHLYGIPDNAAPTEIYSIKIGGHSARVKVVRPVLIPTVWNGPGNGNGNGPGINNGNGNGNGPGNNNGNGPGSNNGNGSSWGGWFGNVFGGFPWWNVGTQARYDGEGIALDGSIIKPNHEGWWIASEGDASSIPNLLVQIDGRGRVLREIQLPASVDPAADAAVGGNMQGGANGETIRSNGFEGVTLSSDGRYLLAAIQRNFAGESSSPRYARIVRYDLMQIVNGTAPQSGLRFGGDWDVFFYQLDSDDGSNWAGLSEIATLGPDQYIVIERDKGIGAGSTLKKVYAFDLSLVTPDQNGIPDGADTLIKAEVVDVLADFFPYEKIEGLAITPQGDLWVGLDNDGGEVEPRLINTGTLINPLP